MTEPQALIPVGKIIGPHGIRGLLKVFSYSGNLESLRAARTITLKSPSGETQELGIKNAALHAGKLILGLQGYDEIDRVLPFVGNEICLLRSQLPEPDENEYYWCDLIGLEVVTPDGTELGAITDIFDNGSNDIYVVRNEKREYLVPAIASVIDSVDLEGRKMVITPLEGLLDL